jgi:hypothetical protein
MWFWAICGTPSFLAHGRNGEGARSAQVPLFRLDVRALGYSPPTVHERPLSYGLPRIGSLSFCAGDEAVVSFVTHATPADLAHRGDPDNSLLPLRLRALFVDAKTGHLGTTRQWPITSGKSRITCVPGGKFIVLTPDKLVLSSLEAGPSKVLQLRLSSQVALGSFDPQASPAGKYLLIESELPGGAEELFCWIDSNKLQLIRRWAEEGGTRTVSISDDGRAAVMGKGGAAYVGNPGGPPDALAGC